MSRVDQYSISVNVTGIGDLGVWDKMSGGAVDSEEKKYKPGALAPEVSLGGTQTTTNVTVSRLYSLTVDHPKVKPLQKAAGKASMTVTKQPLDIDGLAFGTPLVYTGILKTVTPPDPDSESNDAALISLEMSSAGGVS